MSTLGKIDSPDSWNEGHYVDVDRMAQRLKPCEYDIDKFIECIKNAKNNPAPNYAGWLRDCDVWARDTLKLCVACSKRN